MSVAIDAFVAELDAAVEARLDWSALGLEPALRRAARDAGQDRRRA